jgi:hypothetical protein
MQPLNRHITVVTGVTLAVLLLVSLPARSEPSGQVEQIIQHLITYVSGSDLRFVRNASEYTPQEAAAHMEKKYRHFRDDIETTEDLSNCAPQKAC